MRACTVRYGAVPEMVEPLGCLSLPAAASATHASSMLNTLSLMDASTTCARGVTRSGV